MMLKDYFSDNSEQYSQYRPHYPIDLFQYLASLAPSDGKAWDCACGNGQAAIGLAQYFREVVATDASASQIEKAIFSPRICYQVLPAEHSGFDDQEVDLITVAQAFHWFDIGLFFKEAGRVLKANGILAVWTYNLLSINQEIDSIIDVLYHQILNEYWPQERKMVENGYDEIVFPFSSITPPLFEMREEWSVSQLVGYLNTWSAVKRYKREYKGQDQLPEIFNQLSVAWGEAGSKQTVTWPLKLIIQKKCPSQSC